MGTYPMCPHYNRALIATVLREGASFNGAALSDEEANAMMTSGRAIEMIHQSAAAAAGTPGRPATAGVAIRTAFMSPAITTDGTWPTGSH
jgi:beta-glucosidase-like glycosyl hydrolase